MPSKYERRRKARERARRYWEARGRAKYAAPEVLALPGRYLLRIALSVDQLFNVLAGGDPDETISSRIGRRKRSHGGRIPWSRPFIKIIDAGLEVIDPGHCIDAIEEK